MAQEVKIAAGVCPFFFQVVKGLSPEEKTITAMIAEGEKLKE